MSNLEDPRIKVVKSVDEAEELIAQEFAHLTPISYRGIVASVDGPVLHKGIRYETSENTVKDIDQILIDGTEMDVDDPDPIISVIAFEFSKLNISQYVRDHPLLYIGDLKQEAGLHPEEMKKLRHTILAYDSTVINHINHLDCERCGYTATLPLDREQRAQAILRAYVVDEIFDN